MRRVASITWTLVLVGLAFYSWYACYAITRRSRIDHDYSGVQFGEFYTR